MLDEFNSHVLSCKLCKGARCEYCETGKRLKMETEIGLHALHLDWLNKKNEFKTSNERREIRRQYIDQVSKKYVDQQEFINQVSERYLSIRKGAGNA